MVTQSTINPLSIGVDEQHHITSLIIKDAGKIIFIDLSKITHVESCNYYSIIHEAGKPIIVRKTLKELEKLLAPHLFFRIHRSLILNISIFKSFERVKKNMVVHTSINKAFRISRSRGKDIIDRFSNSLSLLQ